MKTINEVGIKEIREFLAANHKLGGDHFNQDMLNAWAADAETRLDYGNSATIEIRAADSVSGHTVSMTVSDAGIDAT